MPKKPVPCSFEECDRMATVKGYCTGHYQQLLRKEPLKPLRTKGKYEQRYCTFPNCTNVHLSKGLCATHYTQKRKGFKLKPVNRNKSHARYRSEEEQMQEQLDGLNWARHGWWALPSNFKSIPNASNRGGIEAVQPPMVTHKKQGVK